MNIYVPTDVDNFVAERIVDKHDMLYLMVDLEYSDMFGTRTSTIMPFVLHGNLVKDARMEHAWDGWSG